MVIAYCREGKLLSEGNILDECLPLMPPSILPNCKNNVLKRENWVAQRSIPPPLLIILQTYYPLPIISHHHHHLCERTSSIRHRFCVCHQRRRILLLSRWKTIRTSVKPFRSKGRLSGKGWRFWHRQINANKMYIRWRLCRNVNPLTCCDDVRRWFRVGRCLTLRG